MKVLFVCEGNMMRSQMAEAFYRALGGSGEVISAGSAAAQKDHIAERAKIVMDEISVPTEGMRSDQLTEEMMDWADLQCYNCYMTGLTLKQREHYLAFSTFTNPGLYKDLVPIKIYYTGKKPDLLK